MRSLVIGTAGHIDHGKSALVQALTGTNPDRLKEEKARGITIDLGFAHYQQDELAVAFVDVPGHERFVRNMLAGAGGFDAVMLVIAADESVMPQTREHFAICRLLGLTRGLIAITKSDVADEDMRGVAELDARELVAGSFLEGAPMVHVSSRTGDGLETLRAAITALAGERPGRAATGPARLPIDRAFTVKGFGTVVTGTLISGALEADGDYALLPAGRPLRVRGLQSHGQTRGRVDAGSRLAVNLGGIDVGEIRRGDTLAAPGAFSVTRRFDAILENDSPHPIRNGARLRVYQGTSEAFGRVTLGAAAPDDAASEGTGSAAAEAPVVAVEPGARAFARVRLDTPIVLTRGDRFVVRSYSPLATIGGGIVIDPEPRRAPVRSPVAARRFRRLAPQRGLVAAVEAMVDEGGVAGLMIEGLVARAGLARDQVPSVMSALGPAVVLLGERLISANVLDRLEARVLDTLAAHHSAHPLSEGLPREELRERALPGVPHEIAVGLMSRLEERRKVAGRERLSLAGHQLSMSDDEARVVMAIEAKAAESGYQALDAAGLAVAVGAETAMVQRLASLLVRQKRLIRLDTLLYAPETLEALKADVRTLSALDVAVFKTRYGVTRKFAIPLLEYLDRERVTRRVGDKRVLI